MTPLKNNKYVKLRAKNFMTFKLKNKSGVDENTKVCCS